MDQTYAISGLKRRPAGMRRAQLEAQSANVPAIIQQQQEKRYADDMFKLQQDQLAEQERQNSISNAFTLKEMDRAKKAQDRAKLVDYAGLGLTAASTANQMLGDQGIAEVGKKALSAVIPDFGSSDLPMRASPDAYWERMTGSGPIGIAADAANDFIVEPVKDFTKYLFGDDGFVSDVAGWGKSLWDDISSSDLFTFGAGL